MVYFSIAKHRKTSSEMVDMIEKCYIMAMLEEYPTEMAHWLSVVQKALRDKKGGELNE